MDDYDEGCSDAARRITASLLGYKLPVDAVKQLTFMSLLYQGATDSGDLTAIELGEIVDTEFDRLPVGART